MLTYALRLKPDVAPPRASSATLRPNAPRQPLRHALRATHRRPTPSCTRRGIRGGRLAKHKARREPGGPTLATPPPSPAPSGTGPRGRPRSRGPLPPPGRPRATLRGRTSLRGRGGPDTEGGSTSWLQGRGYPAAPSRTARRRRSDTVSAARRSPATGVGRRAGAWKALRPGAVWKGTSPERGRGQAPPAS